MTDQTSNPEPEDVIHDADGDQVNVEAVNDGEATPGTQPGAASPAGGGGNPPSPQAGESSAEDTPARESSPRESESPDAESAATDAAGEDVHPDTALAAQRLEDYQRLQADYVNYRRRADRDRAETQIRATHDVIESMLPVLDEIHLAREHGDLDDGPFKAIAEKLEQALQRYGVTRIGAKGEAFDPTLHEALMHAEWDSTDPELPADATSTTIVTLLQPGYQVGDRVLRAARVAVADPQ